MKKFQFSVTSITYLVVAYYVVAIFLGHTKSITFNSDSLYLNALFTDVFVYKHSFSSWHLTPAPYFFPDMLVSFGINFFIRNVFYVFLFYAVFQCLITLFLASKICSLVTKSKTSVMLAHITFLIALTIICPRGNNEPFNIVFLSAFHFGAVINGLFLILFCILYARTSRNVYLVCSFMVIALGAVSDLFFIVQFVFPLMATLLLCRTMKVQIFPQYIRFCAILVLGSVIGFSLKFLFQTAGVSHYFLTHRLSFSGVVKHFFLYYTGDFSQHLFIETISLVFYAFLLFQLVKKLLALKSEAQLDDRKKLILFLSFFILISACFSWVNFSVNFFSKARYLLNYFWFPVFFSWILYDKMLNEKRLGQLLGVLFLSAAVYPFFSYSTFIYTYTPPLVTCVDEYVHEYNLHHQEKIKYGIANYWEEKLITAFSVESLVMAQYITQLNPHMWITTSENYRDTYDFAVIRDFYDSDLDQNYIEKINGKPKAIFYCDKNISLLIYGQNKLHITLQKERGL